jgi:serine/threonine-protein kinase
MVKSASDTQEPFVVAKANRSGMMRSLSPTSTRVGRYRVLSELGRGGMANVFLAVAQGPGGVNKLVVLKALLPELASENESLTMFLDEARLAAQLNHPNVVQTYEVGREGDRHVMVMEYLEGQSFSAVMKRGDLVGNPMALKLQLRVIMNALEGLGYAHELSSYDGTPLHLVHRDISPQNVFVTYDGQVKVLDFGIAKAASSSTHTATGVIKGKLAYMAPEQIVANHIDHRADLYSIGCMLWAAATGRKLWKDTPDVQIMRRVMQGDVPPPQSANPGCDDELNHIVMKALAWQREKRYQSAHELQQDLDAYCERYTGEAKQKDLAGYVSSLFSETRAELKALIERRLSLSATEESMSAPATMVVSQTQEAIATEGAEHDSWQPTEVGDTPAAKRPRRSALVIGSAALALAAAFVLTPRLSGRSVPSLLTSLTTRGGSNAGASSPVVPEPPRAPAVTPDSLPPLIIHDEAPAAPAPTATANSNETRSSVRRKLVFTRPVVAPKPAASSAAVQPEKQPDRKVSCEAPFYLAPDGTRRLRPECE